MKTINLVIISGSHRKNSESSKVAHYIEKTIFDESVLKEKLKPTLINLANEDTPFYEDNLPESGERFTNVWNPLAKKLDDAQAFVIISPEWSGMVPSKLKNLFLLVGQEVCHKPALLVTVSASFGGHYPIAELRMSSYKNSKICYIPDNLIIRHVGEFNKNPSAKEFTEVRERLQNNLHTLTLYAERLDGIGKIILNEPLTKKYPYGM